MHSKLQPVQLVLFAITICVSVAGRTCAADRVVLFAGGEGPEKSPAVDAKLLGPFGIDFDQFHDAYLVEIAGHRVLRITPTGLLSRIAGTGEMGNQGDGGKPLQAQFNGMHSLVVDNSQIYIADTWNHRVRRVDLTTDLILPFAGTGEKGYAGDGGPAKEAKFGGIYCVALDPARKQLLLTDLDNRRIRVVNLETGIVNTIAGNGQKGKPVDGKLATESPLVDPRAAVMDGEGNCYILERGGHALRRVNAKGVIETLVGDGKGDTTLNGPKHLCLDGKGGVVIADTENHRIIRYSTGDGKTQVIAGTGEKGAGGVNGPPLQVQLNQPHGVTFGPSGELFIVDSSNNRVLRIVKD